MELLGKYEDWKKYCELLDNIIPFMNQYYSGYSSFHKKDKEKIAEEMKRNSITMPIAIYLKKYTSITENKIIEAKEDKLLEFDLPRLNNQQIVKRFVKIYTQDKDTQI